MITRFVETLFRHLVAIALPIVLIPLIVGVVVWSTSARFEASAGVWVERPTYLTYVAGDEFDRYLSPAQSQVSRLGELLQTRAFVSDVARRTTLAPLIGSERGDTLVARLFEEELEVSTEGRQLLVVRFRADTPELAVQAVTAVVEAFKEKSAKDRLDQAQLAISFWEQRLQETEAATARSNEALVSFAAANPNLGRSSDARAGRAPTATDLQLADLERRYSLDVREQERSRNMLDQARLDSTAALKGQALFFQVVDAPRTPTERTPPGLRKLLLPPIAALLFGMGTSATLLVLLVATDRSIRSGAELAGNVRVLGVVPRLRLKGVSRRVGPEATRRAIGFSAGAALEPGGA